MKLRRWIIFLGWLFLTVYLSRQEGASSAEVSGFLTRKLAEFVETFATITSYARFHFYIRKLAHIFVHFVLAILCYRAVRTTATNRIAAFWVALFISVMFAGIDEFIQIFATGRFASPFDAGLNLFGVISGTFLGRATMKNFRSEDPTHRDP